MKQRILVLAVMAFLWTGVAFAEMAGLPSNKAMVKSGSGEVTVKVDKASGAVTVEVPVGSQSGAPVLYRSIARASNNAWAQVTDGKYEVATKVSAGQAVANLALGKGIYRVRIWGKVGANWLFVSQASQYSRKDAKGDVAYEFIVNTDTGEVMPVPNDYPAWN